MTGWRRYTPRGVDYRPLRVIARMTEPLVYFEDLMHLDGILAWAEFSTWDRERARGIPHITAEWVIDMTLPLSRWVVPVGPEWGGGDRRLLANHRLRHRLERAGFGDPPFLWGWCASAEIAEWVGRGRAEIRKRPCLDEMRRYADAKTEQIGSGPRKGYDLAMPLVLAREIEWYAHGDRDQVQLLLDRVPAIGKKRQLGWGTVEQWIVEECEEDLSVVRAGEFARRMPREAGPDGVAGRGPIRAPYHHPSRVVEAVEPWR